MCTFNACFSDVYQPAGESATVSPHLRDQAPVPDVSSQTVVVVAASKPESQLSAEITPKGAPKASAKGGSVEHNDDIYDMSVQLAAIEKEKNKSAIAIETDQSISWSSFCGKLSDTTRLVFARSHYIQPIAFSHIF